MKEDEDEIEVKAPMKEAHEGKEVKFANIARS